MLKDDERETIVQAMANRLFDGLTAPDFIRLAFRQEVRNEFRALPNTLTDSTSQATWIVDVCVAHRWNANPALLAQALTLLISRGENVPALQPILARVNSGIDPNPDPYLRKWVLADQPFLDRSNLREKVRLLLENPAKPVLRVFGPSKSGKSYTTEFLSYVAHVARRDLHIVPVSMSPGTGPSYELSDLVESLTLTMTEHAPPATSNTAAGQGRWVIGCANRNPGVWVFVLDGFAQENVKSEVLEFIDFLATQVSHPEYARRLRLVLLDYDKNLTGNWRAKTHDDKLEGGAIVESDILDCLTEFNSNMDNPGNRRRMIRVQDLPAVSTKLLNKAKLAPSPLSCLYEDLVALAIR